MGVCHSKRYVSKQVVEEAVVDDEEICETVSFSSSERGHPKNFVYEGDLSHVVDCFRTQDGGLNSTTLPIEPIHTVVKPVTIEDTYDGVHDGFVLGTGVTGVVRAVTHRTTDIQYAVKCIDFSIIGKKDMRRFREEIYIMCQLDHPNVIRLEEVYETSSSLYLVMELCAGGDLFECLEESNLSRYSEEECLRIVKQMLKALQYIHSKGIIHRDLKLENFLFASNGTNSELKLIDFGLSKHFKVGEMQCEAVGTPYTIAPELFSGRYDERSDVWSVGVLLYIMLSGEAPFGGCYEENVDMEQLKKNITAGYVPFEPKDIWSSVSEDAKIFVESLLERDPHKRPTAAKAQRARWIADADTNCTFSPCLDPIIIKQLSKYYDNSALSRVLCKVVSLTIYPFWFNEFRQEFNKFERNVKGEVSFQAFRKVYKPSTQIDDRNVFDAICINSTRNFFQRHDFNAAVLTLCDLGHDDISYVFQQIDATGKGYISSEDMMSRLMANNTMSQDEVRMLYPEELQATRISIEDLIELLG